MTTVANTSASTSTSTVTPTTSVTNENGMLDKDGFLKMLVAQMQNQDPTSPMSTSDQTQQMAAFTQVEQITNMANENQQMLAAMTQQTSIGMLGHTVSYLDAGGNAQSGTVESVSTSKGSTTLTIAGQTGIDPSSVTSVS